MINDVYNVRHKRITQTITYLPHFISWVVVATMVYKLFDPGAGAINRILAIFGRESIPFMREPSYFRNITILASVWKELGWNAIIYIAAITSIDPQLFEAAVMDGAGRMRIIWNVTLPSIAQTIALMFILKVYTVAYSFSDGHAVLSDPVVLLPVEFTLNNYKAAFNNNILNSFFISVARTVIGMIFTLLVTGTAAYMLSKRHLPGNRLLSYLFIIPMYIQGGMIATFVNISHLGLMNNFLIYILPYGFVAYYMLIMRTFFASIPDSLEESAQLDGAGDVRIFFRIVLPLAMPVIATIALFGGVFQRNMWFDAMVYVPNTALQPLQLVLQNVLKQASGLANMKLMVQTSDVKVTSEAVQMATLVIATVPILAIYPFVQRYFVKGVMIGAVKAWTKIPFE